MDRNQAILRVPPVPTLYRMHGQQSVNLYFDDTEPGCARSLLGSSLTGYNMKLEYLKGSDYEKHFYAARQKEFTVQDNLLYLQATPANSQDMAPVFVVLNMDRQAAIDGCHRSMGHQGRDRTLSLMKE